MARFAPLATVFRRPQAPADTPPAPPTVAEIEQKLAAITAELDATRTEHRETAFDAVSGDAQAAEREAVLAEKIAGQGATMRALQAALIVARQREEAAGQKLRLEAQAALRGRVARKITKRTAIAAELEDHLTKAAAAFRKLHRTNLEIQAAYPFKAQPDGTLLGSSELVRVVEHELYRLGGVPVRTGPPSAELVTPSFPGGQPPSIMLSGTPEQITPLHEVIEAANETAIRIMDRGIATAPLLAVPADDAEAA